MTDPGDPAAPADPTVPIDADDDPTGSTASDRARPERLFQLLRDLGVDDSELDEADQADHLPLLVIERLAMGEEPSRDLDEVAQATGMAPDLIIRLWRSLGLVEPRPGDRTFTDADVHLVGTVGQLLEVDVIDHDLTLQMARVIGSSLTRVATALVEAVEPPIDPDGHPEGSPEAEQWAAERVAMGDEFALLAPQLMPTLVEIMERVWRRHLQAAARARIARQQAGTDPTHVVVGFADLVGFTALSQQIGPHELADVVERFETLAYDTIGRLGGRVVKMIGDEVMFTVAHERAAAEIALSLAESYAQDDELSDVRVGLASGPVLLREADMFGPVVNLASRIVSLAFPGTVVCSASVQEALAGDVEYDLRDLGAKKLKDIGRVPLHVLRRAELVDRPRSERERAEARRAERREAKVAEMDRERRR